MASRHQEERAAGRLHYKSKDLLRWIKLRNIRITIVAKKFPLSPEGEGRGEGEGNAINS